MFALTPSKRQILSTRLMKLFEDTPREFQRKPRSLLESKFYKANEYAMLLKYTGPVILAGLLPGHQYRHFTYLHVALRLVNIESNVHNDSVLDYARKLLRAYVVAFQDIYGPEFVSYNVHVLIHAVDDVIHYRKTLMALSNYKYENS